ncbi:hypothetical protein [Saccharopolyspora sp. NFXS83]|uniref:hypothetical protein n=1 Tax=Saccharopolyspora sp. NFXS83 TaxID=2993560 RepID=UPI00224AA315|nr:hypothetical protein [Saccharopolyspora sp. NFXS83]
MSRMSSRKRITIALVGLIALVVIGWFVQQGTTGHRSATPVDGGGTLVWQAVPVLPDSTVSAVPWRAFAPLGPSASLA